MSRRSLDWAWEQKTSGAKSKTVLIYLADTADDSGTVSAVDLVVAQRYCKLSMKDVLASLDELLESGLIEDAGAGVKLQMDRSG